MQPGMRRSIPDVKAKPIFQRQLVLSTAIFISLVVLVIFGAAYYVTRSLNARVEQEMDSLTEIVAQQVSDQITALGNSNPVMSLTDSPKLRQALQAYLEARLQTIPSLYYMVLETLKGEVVAQSFKENIRPDEVNLLRRGALKPRQPRSQQIELQGQANTQLRIRDIGTPVRLDPRSMGQLRLGISNDYLEERVSTIRHEVYSRSIVLSTIAVALFSTLFLYVRWLLKRAQALEAQAQSADRLAYLGTLSSGLAHEIRNPLSAMNLNVQMIEESIKHSQTGDEELPALFESTKREIKRLERLATNFLTYAKPLHVENHLLDLKELVLSVCREFKSQWNQMGIELNLHVQELDPCPVNGDRDLLKQALLNILLNAKEAVLERKGESPRVEVLLGKSNSFYLVDVFDNGVGISPDHLQSIFGIFQSTKRGGTGLGLPIARQIIEHHRGRIEVESTLGQFSRFIISLPAA